MKYKKGDKVLVIDYDTFCQDFIGNSDFDLISKANLEMMSWHVDDVVTIADVDPYRNLYAIEEAPQFRWTEDMFVRCVHPAPTFRFAETDTPSLAYTDKSISPVIAPTESEIKFENKKENSTMKFNFKSMLSAYMPVSIEDGSVSLSVNGQIVYRRANGDYVYYDSDSEQLVSCMSMTISTGLDKLVFALPVLSVKPGDVILHKGKFVHVTAVDDKTIHGVSLETGRMNNIVREKNLMMGTTPYQKVTSLFTMLMTGGEASTMNPMMLAMAMDGGKDDLFTMLAMMSMMNANTGVPAMGGMNPMMMAMMMGDEFGDGSDMMKMMMMSQMMGGAMPGMMGGMNPFCPAPAQQPVQAPVQGNVAPTQSQQ